MTRAMIERMAQGLAWQAMERQSADYVSNAEALLRLMRRPTPEMLRAVKDCPTVALSCWESMIDAALGGDDEP